MPRIDSDTVPQPVCTSGQAGSALVAELRRQRIAAGLSQTQLADLSGYSREYVSRAERPNRGLCSADLVRALDAVLAADGSLIALHDQAQQEKYGRRAVAVSPDHQPLLSVDTGAASRVPPSDRKLSHSQGDTGTDVASSARLLAMLAPADLDPLTLDDVEERTRALAGSYFRIPAVDFIRAAEGLRDRVAQLHGLSYRMGTRRRLFTVLATLTALMAEASFAAGEPTDTHCCAALALAEEADDGELVAWIRGTQAQIALHTGNPVAAGRYARAGVEAAPPGTTAHVRSASYVARSAARRRDRSEALQAWDLAMTSWGLLPATSPGNILSLEADYPAYCELTLRAWLGDTGRAKIVIDQAPSTDEAAAPSTARAITQIDTALIRVLDGEIDEAIACGNRALRLGAVRSTPPLLDRLTDLARSLAESPSAEQHRPARELVGRLTSISD